MENEAEKYWCENCINFDREHIGMDATAICAITKQLQYAQNYGAECPFYDVPAADVEEVRHGVWIADRYCSRCKFDKVFFYTEVATYCPWCGAKMDGGGEE